MKSFLSSTPHSAVSNENYNRCLLFFINVNKENVANYIFPKRIHTLSRFSMEIYMTTVRSDETRKNERHRPLRNREEEYFNRSAGLDFSFSFFVVFFFSTEAEERKKKREN